MYELKKLHQESAQRAVDKARQYRLLNMPRLAESICLDILELEPGNQEVLAILVLALSDQFNDHGVAVSNTRIDDVLPRLTDPYERTYYEGIVAERRGIAALAKQTPGYMVHGWFAKALALYEQAAELAPEGNEDAVLRWNTCARILNRNPSIRPSEHEPLSMVD